MLGSTLIRIRNNEDILRGAAKSHHVSSPLAEVFLVNSTAPNHPIKFRQKTLPWHPWIVRRMVRHGLQTQCRDFFVFPTARNFSYCPGDFLEKLRFRVICVSFIRGVFVGGNGWRTFRRSRCACFWKNNVLPMLNSKISCFFL